MDKIGIVGLGYVGLPLAIEFSQHYDVVGFDLNTQRIDDLKNNIDKTDTDSFRKKNLSNLYLTSNITDISSCNTYIVTVPTPVNDNKEPDLTLLKKACLDLSSLLKKGDTVVFESTVYPGATEEECIPLLEANSGLKASEEFFYGYSPERVNPGDNLHPLENVQKIVSGCSEQSKEYINNLYSKIILAGTVLVSSIKVAEAAKVVENIQRDVNIALMNELKIVFEKMEIPPFDVFNAAATKWNFLQFTPGLVGGHCIGIDPYYLSWKSSQLGYLPSLISTAREVNEQMSEYYASAISEYFDQNPDRTTKVLILGASFKENCSDMRNSKAIQLINILKKRGINSDVYDPIISFNDLDFYGLKGITEVASFSDYGAVVINSLHDEITPLIDKIPQDFCIFDLKGKLSLYK